MTKVSKKYYVFLIVFLGMLSAFGPFVTDMYQIGRASCRERV